MFEDSRYPQRYYINSGQGRSSTSLLNGFDRALEMARLSNYNLLKISSILPAGAVKSDDLHNELKEGAPLLTAYSTINSIGFEEGDKICSAVGVAKPKNRNSVGVIMEYSNTGSAKFAEEKIKKMLDEAMKDRGYTENDYDIEISSEEGLVTTKEEYLVLVSAIAIW